MIGNEEDFTACLGFEVRGRRRRPDRTLETGSIPADDREGGRRSSRTSTSSRPPCAPSRPRPSTTGAAIPWSRTRDSSKRPARPGLEILDRVGGGDSFASGLIYGLLEHGDRSEAVEFGAAHGALAMTTPGDTSMATLAEVEKLARGGNARVQR